MIYDGPRDGEDFNDYLMRRRDERTAKAEKVMSEAFPEGGTDMRDHWPRHKQRVTSGANYTLDIDNSSLNVHPNQVMGYVEHLERRVAALEAKLDHLLGRLEKAAERD